MNTSLVRVRMRKAPTPPEQFLLSHSNQKKQSIALQKSTVNQLISPNTVLCPIKRAIKRESRRLSSKSNSQTTFFQGKKCFRCMMICQFVMVLIMFTVFAAVITGLVILAISVMDMVNDALKKIENALAQVEYSINYVTNLVQNNPLPTSTANLKNYTVLY
uniref:Uncharacterized protein n=1 Tax=Ditylenchus dipsaci TaxID=166011 RepID=A0A915D8Q6_9BILA